MIEAAPWLSLLPPLVAIALAIISRKVLLSLGLGVVVAALLAHDLNPLGAVVSIWEGFVGIFWSDDALSTSSLYIIIFLFLLGVLTALILMAGGSAAFSAWASERIKSRRGAQLLAAVLGIAIFVDDYFNALAVGQVSRPVTDNQRVSRAKLAYIIDSTSAPVSVLAPFSSWGASIIGLLAPVVADSTLRISNVEAFLGAAAANYYAIAAILLVLLVAGFGIDIGSMRVEERRALHDGKPFEEGVKIPGELSEDLPVNVPGHKRSLVVPFVSLVVGVIGSMLVTGWLESRSTNLVKILGNSLVTESLIAGGLLGLATALWYYWKYTRDNDEFSAKTLWRGVAEGLKSMLPAVGILVLAWLLGSMISEIGTGEYLASLVEKADIGTAWLAPLLFGVAAIMAFSTGTSWGSFGILIPIAGEILNALGASEALVPTLGAVLAGAVLGDHCSPISDTTILSATGSSCNIITHVKTQLTYALVAGVAALVGYTVLALSASTLFGLLATLVALAGFVVIANRMTTSLETEAQALAD